MKKQNLKGFIIGALFTLCLTAGIGTVGAASKLLDIRVSQGGISIYVDGTKIKPTDANGNVVEPMIYNGTTYLPVRAVANAFNKEVAWDGETSSVYLGKVPVAEQTPLSDLNLVSGGSSSYLREWTGSKAIYKILDKTYTPFNLFSNSDTTNWATGTYALYSKYSKLKGEFVIAQDEILNYEHTIIFYDTDKKGNTILLEEFVNSAGNEAITVDLNVEGVNLLQIYISPRKGYSAPILYDVFLESAK